MSDYPPIKLARREFFRPDNDTEKLYWHYTVGQFTYNLVDDDLHAALDLIERERDAVIHNAWLRMSLAQAVNLVEREWMDTSGQGYVRRWTDTLERTKP